MPARIRHIALSVKDIDATADFYEKAFGLKRSPKSEGPTAYRVYMSDGEINLALLQYKGETGSGLKNAGRVRRHIHHFGFQCDDIEKQQKQIEAAGGEFFFDLGDPDDDDFERRSFADPNGIIFDINWKGWSLTKGKVNAVKAKGKSGGKSGGKSKAAAARSKPPVKISAAGAGKPDTESSQAKTRGR